VRREIVEHLQMWWNGKGSPAKIKGKNNFIHSNKQLIDIQKIIGA